MHGGGGWGGINIGLSLNSISPYFELDANRNRGFTGYQGNICNNLIRQGCDVNLGRGYRESGAQAYQEAVYRNKAYEASRLGYDVNAYRPSYGRDGCFGNGGASSFFNLRANNLAMDFDSGRVGLAGAYRSPVSGLGWGGAGLNVGVQGSGFSFNLRNLRL